MTISEADLGALLDEVLDGGDGATDSRVVGDGKSGLIKRYVEVTTDQHSLAFQLLILQIGDGALELRLLDNYYCNDTSSSTRLETLYLHRWVNNLRRPSSSLSRDGSILCLLHRGLNLDELGLGVLPASGLIVMSVLDTYYLLRSQYQVCDGYGRGYGHWSHRTCLGHHWRSQLDSCRSWRGSLNWSSAGFRIFAWDGRLTIIDIIGDGNSTSAALNGRGGTFRR